MTARTRTGTHLGAFLWGCAAVMAVASLGWAARPRVTQGDEPGALLCQAEELVTVTDTAGSDGAVVTDGQTYSVCVCPSCGTTVTQSRQAACARMSCPVCGSPMVSSGSVRAWRELVFRPIVIGSLVTAVLVIAAHYLIWGPKRYIDRGGAAVRRFGNLETAAHFMLMSSFVVLAVTGMTGIIGPGANISGSLGGDIFLILHYVAGAFFAIGLVVTGLLWWRDCTFKNYDLEWARHAGGYLGHKENLPAGRFNAGQKAFFWTVVVLGTVAGVTGLMRLFPVFGRTMQQYAYMIHDVVALMIILGILAHLYLGTVANPGTWQAIFSGWVKEEWAEAHHANWDYSAEGSKRHVNEGLEGEALGAQDARARNHT